MFDSNKPDSANLFKHRETWLNALEKCKSYASEQEEVNFWENEIKTFNQTFNHIEKSFDHLFNYEKLYKSKPSKREMLATKLAASTDVINAYAKVVLGGSGHEIDAYDLKALEEQTNEYYYVNATEEEYKKAVLDWEMSLEQAAKAVQFTPTNVLQPVLTVCYSQDDLELSVIHGEEYAVAAVFPLQFVLNKHGFKTNVVTTPECVTLEADINDWQLDAIKRRILMSNRIELIRMHHPNVDVVKLYPFLKNVQKHMDMVTSENIKYTLLGEQQ